MHYLSSQVSYPPTAPAQTTPNPYWPPSASYTSSYRYASTVTQATQPANNPVATPAISTTPITLAPKACADRVPTPLISSLTTHVAAITPNLINQVNAAASANPILSNLLQLAAAGNATADQLKTLGLLIQSLANIENVSSITTPQQFSSSQPTSTTNYYNRLPTSSPVKPFDVVLEFRETPGDRLVFPRGLVHAERLFNSINTNTDISLHMALSNAGPLSLESLQQANDGNDGRYPVTVHLNQASPAIWDTVSRWIGGDEKNDSNKKELQKLVRYNPFILGRVAQFS